MGSYTTDLIGATAESKLRDSSGALGIDEGFCLLDEIPGSGITVCFFVIFSFLKCAKYICFCIWVFHLSIHI